MNNSRRIEGEDLEKYRFAFDMHRCTWNDMWEVFGWFLLAHTVFLAFLLRTVAERQSYACFSLDSFVTGFVGLVLCIPWLATNSRCRQYADFRFKEAKSLEPSGWGMLKERGEEFSKSGISGVGRIMPTRYAGRAVIVTFLVVYLAAVAFSGPWCPKEGARAQQQPTEAIREQTPLQADTLQTEVAEPTPKLGAQGEGDE